MLESVKDMFNAHVNDNIDEEIVHEDDVKWNISRGDAPLFYSQEAMLKPVKDMYNAHVNGRPSSLLSVPGSRLRHASSLIIWGIMAAQLLHPIIA
jgi:hypothetical protein